MQRRSILLAILSSALTGCRSLSPFANRGIVAKFDEVDSIEVIDVQETVTVIEDSESIARIKKIYQNARWQPWMDTMPSGGKHLVCRRGEDVLFELLWVGWLIEWSKSTGPMRKAKIDEVDDKWLSDVTKPPF